MSWVHEIVDVQHISIFGDALAVPFNDVRLRRVSVLYPNLQDVEAAINRNIRGHRPTGVMGQVLQFCSFLELALT